MGDSNPPVGTSHAGFQDQYNKPDSINLPNGAPFRTQTENHSLTRGAQYSIVLTEHIYSLVGPLGLEPRIYPL